MRIRALCGIPQDRNEFCMRNESVDFFRCGGNCKIGGRSFSNHLFILYSFEFPLVVFLCVDGIAEEAGRRILREEICFLVGTDEDLGMLPQIVMDRSRS